MNSTRGVTAGVRSAASDHTEVVSPAVAERSSHDQGLLPMSACRLRGIPTGVCVVAGSLHERSRDRRRASDRKSTAREQVALRLASRRPGTPDLVTGRVSCHWCLWASATRYALGARKLPSPDVFSSTLRATSSLRSADQRPSPESLFRACSSGP
jgi:hypothetical protein